MSDFAYDNIAAYYEAYIDSIHEWEEERDDYIKDKLWETADGDLISVSKITDHYLQNILTYLYANDLYRKDDWIQILEDEQQKRSKNLLDLL